MPKGQETGFDAMEQAFRSQPGDDDYIEPVIEEPDPALLLKCKPKEPPPEPDKIVNENNMDDWTPEEKAAHRQTADMDQIFETADRTRQRKEDGEEVNVSLDERNDEIDEQVQQQLQKEAWYKENVPDSLADQIEILSQPEFLGDIDDPTNPWQPNDFLWLAGLMRQAESSADPRHKSLYEDTFFLMRNQGLNFKEAWSVLEQVGEPLTSAPLSSSYDFPGGLADEKNLNKLDRPMLRKETAQL